MDGWIKRERTRNRRRSRRREKEIERESELVKMGARTFREIDR